jgi:hypothetical protein
MLFDSFKTLLLFLETMFDGEIVCIRTLLQRHRHPETPKREDITPTLILICQIDLLVIMREY